MRTMMSVSLMLLISREAFESSVPRAVVIVAHIQSKSLSRLAWLYLLNPCGLEVRYVAIPVRSLGFALTDLLLARRLLPFTVLNTRSVFFCCGVWNRKISVAWLVCFLPLLLISPSDFPVARWRQALLFAFQSSRRRRLLLRFLLPRWKNCHDLSDHLLLRIREPSCVAAQDLPFPVAGSHCFFFICHFTSLSNVLYFLHP